MNEGSETLQRQAFQCFQSTRTSPHQKDNQQTEIQQQSLDSESVQPSTTSAPPSGPPTGPPRPVFESERLVHR